MIYLDHAATSWPKPEAVYRAMDFFLREGAANPGRGTFRMAVAAEELIWQTRAFLQRLFHLPSPEQVIFTLNCTDALNIALKGILAPGDHVITSNLEHNAVSRPLKRLQEQGVDYCRARHNADGFIEPAAIEELIQPRTKLIVLAHASNVLGRLQPVEEIGKIARRHGVLFLLDAAQTAGAFPLNLQDMPIDILACPGHKGLLGPPGTGLLLLGRKVEINPLREGGTGSFSQEPTHPTHYPDRLEAGTLNTVGIAGLQAGVKFLLETGVHKVRAHEMLLLERLLAGLREIPGVTIYGPPQAEERAGLLSFNLTGWDPQDLAAALDAGYAVACRAGLHCAPWTHQAMGTYPDGAVRFSVGFFTSEAEIDAAVAAVSTLARH